VEVEEVAEELQTVSVVLVVHQEEGRVEVK
jgi:hypothetical protein